MREPPHVKRAAVISKVLAAIVLLRGLWLMASDLLGIGAGRHYHALGSFMNYVVYFGLMAVVGLVFGIVAKSKFGIWGNLAFLPLTALIFFLD